MTAAVALSTSVAGSCRGGDGTGTGSAVLSDSAGIRISTYADLSHAQPPRWKLSVEPTVRIGVANGDSAYQFYRVRGATRLSDGTIVIGDNSRTLRFFDPRGRFRRKIGGDGDGPGQFRMIYFMGAFAGDSLLIYDSLHRRVSVFGPDGVLARDFRIGQTDRTLLLVMGLFRDGAMLADRRVSTIPDGGYAQDTMQVLLIGPDGVTRQSLGRFAGNEYRLSGERIGTRAIVWRNTILFGRRFILRGAGDRLFIGSTDTFNIPAYDATGTLRLVLGSSEAPKASTNDMLEQYHKYVIDDARERGTSAQQITDLRKSQTGDYIAPNLPAFSDLFATRDGNLWVKQYRLPWDGGPSTWWMFDHEGRLAGTIEIPSNFTIREVQGDRVLGVETDDMDVEYVLGYRLEREAQR